MKLKHILVSIALTASLHLSAFSQDKVPITEQDYTNDKIEMADQLRSDGKIWVVVGTIAVIVAGLFVYLILLEKKVRKIEKLTDSEF